ncbi:MAG: DUF6428 family protein [Armatimonadota bacterium]|nr:DUF6428 family protein [Armatimonadota bacterium]
MHPQKPFHLVLPGLNPVPVSFHITEVGHVTKKFIDCGGKVHTIQTCQLQAWLGDDTEHRLLAGKMAGVLNLAEAKGVLPAGEDLDVEFEYEDTALSQYPVENYIVTEKAVVLNLASKHTDCLAKDICLPSLPMAVGTAAVGCCGPSCDC